MRRGAVLLCACLLLLLPSCAMRGNPLPEGMEAETVLEVGRAVVQQLNAGEEDAVYAQLRQDAQSTSSAEDLHAYVASALERAGSYERETEAMATGQSLDSGEVYATAVLCCKHQRKTIIYRVAFDTDMRLIGFEMSLR